MPLYFFIFESATTALAVTFISTEGGFGSVVTLREALHQVFDLASLAPRVFGLTGTFLATDFAGLGVFVPETVFLATVLAFLAGTVLFPEGFLLGTGFRAAGDYLFFF